MHLHPRLLQVTLSPGAPTGTPSAPLQLALEQVPFLAPGAPVSRRVLDEFTTTQHEAGGISLSHAELSRIDAGVSYLDVLLPEVQLRGEVRRVAVPAFCLPHYSDNDVPAMSSEPGTPGGAEPESLHCFHKTRFYEDGAQWVSAQDACTMCSCHRARVQCDAVVCPPLSCPAEVQAAPAPGCQSHPQHRARLRDCRHVQPRRRLRPRRLQARGPIPRGWQLVAPLRAAQWFRHLRRLHLQRESSKAQPHLVYGKPNEQTRKTFYYSLRILG